jgi:hypothetical protein
VVFVVLGFAVVLSGVVVLLLVVDGVKVVGAVVAGGIWQNCPVYPVLI